MPLLLMYEISNVFGCISLAGDVFYSLETLTVATLSGCNCSVNPVIVV